MNNTERMAETFAKVVVQVSRAAVCGAACGIVAGAIVTGLGLVDESEPAQACADPILQACVEGEE